MRKEGIEEHFEDFDEPEEDYPKEDYSKPFRVVVVEDCRKQEEIQATGDLSWHKGWCLGEFEFPDVTKKKPEAISEDWIVHNPELGDESEVTLYNPLIFTDSGCFIWGIQCYWAEDPGEIIDTALAEIAHQSLRKAIELSHGGISASNLNPN